MTRWGVLPGAVRQHLLGLEWERPANLRDRLAGCREFPIKVNLKPPTGREAIEAISHFQAYTAAWRAWPGPGRVEYESRKLPQVDRQDLPVKLVLNSFPELVAFLGPDAEARHRHWESVFQPLRSLSPNLEPALIRNLTSLEALNPEEGARLAVALRQLTPGLGRGGYLRALPLTGLDTKFIEQNLLLLTDLADHQHQGAVRQSGGLLRWLDCQESPRSWLIVRILCEELRAQFGGLAQMQLTSETLSQTPLPGKRVLVVENNASGYALPQIMDTVAIIGGGANVGWTRAPWLVDRQLGYWGDLDTWGLHYLANARRNQAHVQALMMDQSTLIKHASRMVSLVDPNPSIPEGLTAAEIETYRDLLEGRHGGNCLEQERLDADWIRAHLSEWSEAV